MQGLPKHTRVHPQEHTRVQIYSHPSANVRPTHFTSAHQLSAKQQGHPCIFRCISIQCGLSAYVKPIRLLLFLPKGVWQI